METRSIRLAAWSGGTRMLLGILGLLVIGGVSAAMITKGKRMSETTLPAGTPLVAALSHTVSTEHSNVGDAIELKTVAPLKVDDETSIPEGVVIRGEVTRAKGGGRIAGAPELTLRFTRMEIDGREYPIAADPFRIRGKNDVGESVGEIGGGTVVGGVVGAVAGHGTGDVVKGAVVGAAVGTGVAVATKGNQIVLPAGQRLQIRLVEGVKVKYEAERT